MTGWVGATIGDIGLTAEPIDRLPNGIYGVQSAPLPAGSPSAIAGGNVRYSDFGRSSIGMQQVFLINQH